MGVIHQLLLNGFSNRAIRYRLFSSLTTRELPPLQQQEILVLQERVGLDKGSHLHDD